MQFSEAARLPLPGERGGDRRQSWKASGSLIASSSWGQARAAWGQSQEQLAACDCLLEKQALALLASMGKTWDAEAARQEPAGKAVKRRSKKANKTRRANKNEPAGSAWPELCRALFGVDLMKVPGIGVGVVLSLLCEIGVEWSAFGSAGQLSSWMGLCPNNKVSGGKVIRRGVMPGQQWLSQHAAPRRRQPGAQ